MNSLLVNVDKIFQKVREDKVNFHTAFDEHKMLANACIRTYTFEFLLEPAEICLMKIFLSNFLSALTHFVFNSMNTD